MKKTNIEVEGGEILIQSKEGHYAVIPAKERQSVINMVNENCDDCINSYIQTLPKDSDYAEDGSLYSEYLTTDPPNKKDKQHPLDPNPDGSLPSYFEGSNENPIQLDEVTVTADAPDWMKYKEEYNKNNPFNMNEYLDFRVKNASGRERIELINEPTWRKKLSDEAKQKRQDETRSYISEQLVTNKPQGELSRSEWLNSFSAKEEEFVKSNPKYQSSLWADTKRGLISLTEKNYYDTFSNIIKSPDFSNREKQQLLREYKDHPIMSKIGDAAKILSPLSVLSKVAQSTYRDDTTFVGALKGEKNNAGMLEDMVTDPTTYIGAGAVKSAIKGGLKGATKIGGKTLATKVDDVSKNLVKLEQIPLDFKIEDVLKNMEIIKKGNAYFKELDNPESLKRLKEFGDEYEIDLLDAYKKAEKRWDYGNNIGKNDRFQVAGDEIFKDDIVDAMGVSTINKEGIMQGFLSKANKGNKKDLSEHSVNYINKKASIEDYNTIVWHELSHDINKNIIGSSKKLQDDISDMFVKNLDEVDKTKALKAKEVSNRLYKSDWKYSETGKFKEGKSIESTIKDELTYVSKPTETWAFLSTNLRQDLKSTGLIKNYNELLTPEKLEKAIKNGNTIFSRFEPYIKDKDAFIKLFNKMTLSIAPAALYLQSQNQTKK